MATLFDKAKQLANKITDEINKDKWDSNCINTALFNDEPYTNIPKKEEAVDPNTSTVIPYSDAGVAAPVFDPMAGNDRPKTKESSITPVVPAPAVAPAAPAAPPTPSNSGYVKPVFKSRFGGPGGSGYVTSKVPNSNGLRSLADLPVVDRSQSISSIGTMEANRILEEQATKEQKSNLPTQLPQQSIVPQIPKAVQQAQQPAPQPAAPAEESTERCYYVLIKHTKTYPAPGSMVMMRMCDSKYVWTDEAGEDQKPAYKVCPHCGKKAGYTETEMD